MTDKILRDAVKALIDFHDAPIEAKRNDVFVRRIEACRTALNKDPLSMSMFSNKEDYQEAVSKQLNPLPEPDMCQVDCRQEGPDVPCYSAELVEKIRQEAIAYFKRECL